MNVFVIQAAVVCITFSLANCNTQPAVYYSVFIFTSKGFGSPLLEITR